MCYYRRWKPICYLKEHCKRQHHHENWKCRKCGFSTARRAFSAPITTTLATTAYFIVAKRCLLQLNCYPEMFRISTKSSL